MPIFRDAYFQWVPIFRGCLFSMGAYYLDFTVSYQICNHNLTSCLIHSITLHLVLLYTMTTCLLLINTADWSTVCTMFLHASVAVSGCLQGKRGGKAPNHVIDSPPSPQPMLALEILGWMMVCVCVQGGKKSRPQIFCVRPLSGLVEK